MVQLREVNTTDSGDAIRLGVRPDHLIVERVKPIGQRVME